MNLTVWCRLCVKLGRGHKDTVMVGRSMAIHGRAITFGLQGGWLAG